MTSRWLSGAVLSFAVTAGACAGDDEAEGPTVSACEIGAQLSREIEEELAHSAPACQSDDDCIKLYVTLDCAGSHVSSCGTPLHRDAAAFYDKAEADARFCASFRPGRYACHLATACAASKAVCEAQRCVSKLTTSF